MTGIVENVGLTGVILIDIGIGIIFAILTFSLIASALQEAIAGVLNYRGEHLRTGIKRLLKDPDLSDRLLGHPLIEGLKGPKNLIQRIAEIVLVWRGSPEKDRMPSSIPKATFARALVESLVLRRDDLVEKVDDVADGFSRALSHIDEEIDKLALDHRLKARVKDIVATMDLTAAKLEAEVEQTIAQVEAELADWFDTAMDRVTGWYVRRAKTVLFLIGFAMAAVTNFDIIGYGAELARNDALRNAIVNQAELTSRSGQVGTFRLIAEADTSGDGQLDARELANLNDAARRVATTAADGLDTLKASFSQAGSIGWVAFDAAPSHTGSELLRMFVSWLIIGLGCTLGGQFWFDLLKTFLKVRAGASGLNSDLERIGRDLGAANRAAPDGGR